MIGSTISHYKILEKLGEGGMGVVYKAQDLKLNRLVALKFIPPQLSATEHVKRRFIHEAQAASALDHPNICNIYEIGESDDGQLFLAMAFYEGIPLNKKIEHGPLKIKEALDIAAQVAEGLHTAHEKGIVHRDVKSSNIMLTEKGRAIIMDFGIARRGDVSNLTKTGSTLGTVPYMSPEQARADKVDHRTDVWSLGAVIYEMVTGRLPFMSEYQESMVYSILNEDAEPITSLRSNVPMELERIVSKCLEKDPVERYQHADELIVDIRKVKQVDSTSFKSKTVQASFLSRIRRRNLFIPVLGWLLAFFSISFLLLEYFKDSKDATAYRRFTLDLPEASPMAFVGDSPLGVGAPSLALSPDGAKLVYVAWNGVSTELRLRNLNGLETSPLPGTESAYHPVFSPSGEWIAFFSRGELKKIASTGGPALVLTKVTEPFGLAWPTENRLLVADVQGGNLTWVPATGGSAEILARVQARSPYVLPGDKWIVYRSGDRELHLLSLETKGVFVLTQRGFVPVGSAKNDDLVRGSNPIYLASGHLTYFPSGGDGLMMSIEFDPSAPKKTVSPFPFLDGVRQEGEAGFGQVTMSNNGLLIYAAGKNAGLTRFVRIHRSGKRDTLPFPRTDFGQFKISPDGARILAITWPEAGRKELTIFDLNRRERVKVFADMLGNYFDWWPDGKSIVYTKRAHEQSEELLILRQGVSDPQPRDTLLRGRFSARQISFNRSVLSLGYGGRVGVLNLSNREVKLLIEDSTTLFQTPSPNGLWMAYTSRMSGQSEIWIASISNPEDRHKISIDGGEEPVWTRRGDELVYRNADKWMTVSISTKDNFTASKPRVLFRGSYRNVPGWSHDVFPDGSHLVLAGQGNDRTVRLNVVTNCFELLNRLSQSEKK